MTLPVSRCGAFCAMDGDGGDGDGDGDGDGPCVMEK